MKKHLSLIVALFLITGCTIPYHEVMQEYENTPICCSEYRQIAYETIGLPELKAFNLDKTSDMFSFETGRSYFKAFKLPQFAGTYRIEITSYALGNHEKNAYIFAPQVMFLDSAFNITRIVSSDNFTYVEPYEGALWLSIALRGTIQVAKDNAGDVYMIIYTTEQDLAKKMKYKTPATLPIPVAGTMLLIPLGKRDVYIPYSPVGRIRVKTTIPK